MITHSVREGGGGRRERDVKGRREDEVRRNKGKDGGVISEMSAEVSGFISETVALVCRK